MERPMRTARRTTLFGESAIREMTRVAAAQGAINLSQGMPDLPAPEEVKLAASRAIGETMAVTLAAGATPNLTLNPLESIQTMTAYIVQVSLGDTPADTIEYKTIFAVGALLFIITFGMNMLATRVMRRFREVYE